MKTTLSKSTLSAAIGAVVLSMTGACTTQPMAEAVPPIYNLGETSTVTGMLTYRERIALPPGAIATVSLLETSRADARATIVNEVRYDLAGVSVPFAFTLEKPNQGFEQSDQLVVRAVIRDRNGDLLFTTDTVHPVMTRPLDQDLGTLTMVSAARGVARVLPFNTPRPRR